MSDPTRVTASSQSHTSTSTHNSTSHGTSGGAGATRLSQRKSAGSYGTQVSRLAPTTTTSSATTVTLAGVTLSAHAVGTQFQALERALGDDWARRARAAAADGGSAVLTMLGPHVPESALRLPLVHDIIDAYARWARTQPAPSSGTTKKKGLGDAAPKNLALGKYGLMVDLEAALGKSLALLAPSAGQSVGVHASGAVSVEGIYLGMGFDLEAEHADDGFTVSGAAKFEIGLGTTGENASLSETLKVTGHGDDAVEAMHMAGLAIERFLRDQQFDWKNPSWDGVLSTGKKYLVNIAAFEAAGSAGVLAAGALALAGAKIADALWGKDFERDIVKQMDDDDYGSHQIGVGVGMSGGSDDVGLGVGVDYTHETKVTNVNGAVGQSTTDMLSGHFELSVGGGGFELGVSGHMDVPTDFATAAIGLEIDVARSNGKEAGATGIVADLAANAVRGLATKTAKRAGGWLGRIADAVDAAFRVKAAADALRGAAGVKLTADYDQASGDLALAVIVTKGVELSAEAEVGEVSISFETGQEIVALTRNVGRI